MSEHKIRYTSYVDCVGIQWIVGVSEDFTYAKIDSPNTNRYDDETLSLVKQLAKKQAKDLLSAKEVMDEYLQHNLTRKEG